MERLKRSKLARARFINSSDDDVKLDRNLKKRSGRGLKTAGLCYFMKESCGGDRRGMEDSMKGYEHDIAVDCDYLEYLTSDHMSVRKNQDKKVVNDDCTHNDPQYDMFLSCLKPHGTSCVLEVSENDDLLMPIVYGLDESDELMNQEFEGKSKDVVIEPKTATKNMVLRSYDNHQTSFKGRSVNSEDSDSLCRVNIQCNGLLMPIVYVLESDELLNQENEGKSKDIVIEPKTATNNVVVRSYDNHQTLFKDCSVNSEESDSLGGVDIQSNAGKVEEDDDDGVYIGNSDGDIDSGFRKDVIQILRKPYNHVEHKELLDMISARKPMDRHIDLRNGRTGFYAGVKDGKSYLDQFSVVRQKLDTAKDPSENLNLLRGFFFWLQNLTRENSFQPWKDKACLAVLPQAAVGKMKRNLKARSSF